MAGLSQDGRAPNGGGGKERRLPADMPHPAGGLRALWRLAVRVARIVARRNLGLIAAGVAFFAMLAVFPGAAAVIALWGYVFDPHMILDQIAVLAEFVPDEAYAILHDQVQALVAANNSTLGWTSVVSTAAALWSARAGVAALMGGLDAIHHTEARSGFWNLLAALLFTLILVAVALVALASAILLPIVLAVIPLGAFEAQMLGFMKWAVSLAVVVLGIGMLYRHGPNRGGRRTAWLSPGLILAVVLWAAASVGFSYYIADFASYNRVYGSIGAVIALLMWFYLSAYVILLGAALNEALEGGAPA